MVQLSILAPPVVPTIRMVITTPGPQYGRTFVLRDDGLDRFIGSSSRADVRIDDPSVSHHHARLRWHGTDLVIRDLGSRWGTHLNGTRFRGAHYLQDRDDLRFGDVEVRVEVQLPASSPS